MDLEKNQKSGDIRILPMETGEEERIRDLIRREFLRHVAPHFTDEGIARFLSDLQDTFSPVAADEHVLTAVRDGEVLGILIYRDPSHIRYFFVDSACQRQGVGRALFAETLRRMRAHGADTVTVNAAVNAVEGYRRMGFAPTDDEQFLNGFRYVPMKRETAGPKD